MAWPATITDDADLKGYASFPGLWRLLEDGDSFAGAHIEAAEHVKFFIRNTHGADPEKVTNASDFKTAALNRIIYKRLMVTNPELAKKYDEDFYRAAKGTTPICDTEDREDGGGDFAPINVFKASGRDSRGRGGGPWYRNKPSGGRYGGF